MTNLRYGDEVDEPMFCHFDEVKFFSEVMHCCIIQNVAERPKMNPETEYTTGL
jgi:hypothetical protein